MPSDTLFLNYRLNSLIWLIFLQKRNANVKYKPPFTITPVILRLVSEISELVGQVQALSGSTSHFLCKENRIRTIHASLLRTHAHFGAGHSEPERNTYIGSTY